MSSQHLIELSDLTRKDPSSGQTILDRVNVNVDSGERIGLVGPSGSGKTTLMRAIAILDPYHSGSLRYEGKLIERDEVPNYRRQVIYLAQQPAFADGTVAENIQLPFQLGIASSDFDRSVVETWLSQLGKPASILSQQVDSLSGGEKQLVSFIRAIALSPQVLLLDEPTAALDAETNSQLEQLIVDWHQSDESRALLWSSHDLAQVNRLTSRRIEMNDGKVVAGGSK